MLLASDAGTCATAGACWWIAPRRTVAEVSPPRATAIPLRTERRVGAKTGRTRPLLARMSSPSQSTHGNMRPQYVQEHILVDDGRRAPHTGGHSNREEDVPYPKNHRVHVKSKIVASARRLFNRQGFDNVSLDDIMRGAGLTRGGFYSYFRTKSELYAEVLGCFFTDPEWKNCWDGIEVDLASRNAGSQVVNAYLSDQHFEDIENSCPMVALPGDVTRADASAKQAFEPVFTAMVGVLERSVAGYGRRRRAKAE